MSFRSDLRRRGHARQPIRQDVLLVRRRSRYAAAGVILQSPSSASGLSVYEQVYNASIFSLYLPIANEADFKNALTGRNYTVNQFYHTLLMTNHMESDPDEFAEGIRGKVLWHDEYRTEKMYNAFANKISTKFPTRTFAAAFDPKTAPAPFHNNTCDGCHVRNGSGIPINADVSLMWRSVMRASGSTGVHDRSVYNPYGNTERQGLYLHGANTAHEAGLF